MVLPVVCLEDPGRRQTALPSPVRPKRQATFKNPKGTKTKWISPPTTPDRQSQKAASSWSWPWGTQGFRTLPELDAHVQDFLSRMELSDPGEDGSDHSLMPKPSFDDPQELVRWCAHQVETPAWWPKLVKVPTSGDPISFARRVWASFQFPKVKCLGKGENDHTLPPTPHCVEGDTFLPKRVTL